MPLNVSELPAGVVKYQRVSNGHFYIWDGNFTNPAVDLNDPPLGIGGAINEVYDYTVAAIVIEEQDDDEFQVWLNFLQANRNALVAQIAAAIS